LALRFVVAIFSSIMSFGSVGNTKIHFMSHLTIL
jgi:hypothetical protein